MKKYFNKQTIVAFILGALIFSSIPASAAIQEYLLYQSEVKLVVDGVETSNPDLPILVYKGYNYIPAAAFRDICSKIGVAFQWVGGVNQIQISTEEVSIMDEQTTATPAPVTTTQSQEELVKPTVTRVVIDGFDYE